jgi:hypothetical protein
MPSNFDEMAGYHNQMAAHYQEMAQAARARGDRNEAEFLASQAVRYAAAAEEQKSAMLVEPGPALVNHRSHPWPPPPEPVRHSLVATRLLSVLSAIRHSVSKPKDPFNGLSLR